MRIIYLNSLFGIREKVAFFLLIFLDKDVDIIEASTLTSEKD